MSVSIEKVEHLNVGGHKVVRIVWRHPLSAMGMCVDKANREAWGRMITDWMPADTAKELAAGITKALRTRPKVVQMPKAKPA